MGIALSVRMIHRPFLYIYILCSGNRHFLAVVNLDNRSASVRRGDREVFLFPQAAVTSLLSADVVVARALPAHSKINSCCVMNVQRSGLNPAGHFVIVLHFV